jgi:hypothetical protein
VRCGPFGHEITSDLEVLYWQVTKIALFPKPLIIGFVEVLNTKLRSCTLVELFLYLKLGWHNAFWNFLEDLFRF